MIGSQTPGHVDKPLFSEYPSMIFALYATVVRSVPELKNESAVLLMDSALPHTSKHLKRMLGENIIIVITFPVRTTNLFQALDLVFFGALTKLKPTAGGESDDGSKDASIPKVVQADEQTATSVARGASFRKAAIEQAVTMRLCEVQIKEEKLIGNQRAMEQTQKLFSERGKAGVLVV